MMMIERSAFSELCRHPKKMAVVVAWWRKQAKARMPCMMWRWRRHRKTELAKSKKKRDGEEAKMEAKAGAILVSVEFLFCIVRTSLF